MENQFGKLTIDTLQYGPALPLTQEQSQRCGTCYFVRGGNTSGTVCDLPRYVLEDDKEGFTLETLEMFSEDGTGIPEVEMDGARHLNCTLGVVSGVFSSNV